MNRTIRLKQDKITKNTVRYAEEKDQYPLQVYLQKQEIIIKEGPKIATYPDYVWVTITTEEPKA